MTNNNKVKSDKKIHPLKKKGRAHYTSLWLKTENMETNSETSPNEL